MPTIQLFKKQGEAFLCKKQFILVCCGIQSGKTYLGATWARNKIDKFPNKNGLISAPTYKILNQSTLDKFFSLFPDLRKFYKEQKSIIELPTGGKVFIRSADQPLGIEGMTVHWAWLDEYGQAPKLAWTVVRSRVSTTGGQVMITTTPYAMNWLYGDVYERWAKKEDPDIAVFTWKSIENPFFPKSYYDKERTRLSKEEFRRRYEGEFSRMEGLVYEDFTTDLIIEPRVIEGISTTAGVDFGFTNPTAIEVIRKDKDGKFYVIDEYYEAGKTQEEINQACLFLKRKHNIKAFYPDTAEPDRILSMRKAGLVCIEEKKDIAAGIDKVRSLFREKRLFVFRTCSNLIDELQTYHYQEQDEKEIKEEPVKDKDHACDALRYNIAAERDIGKAEYLGDIKKRKFRMPADDFRVDIDKIIKENQEYQNQDSWKY